MATNDSRRAYFLAKGLEVRSSEAELDRRLLALERELPQGDVARLLYHARPELTVEEAIEEAMRRQRAWEQGQR